MLRTVMPWAVLGLESRLQVMLFNWPLSHKVGTQLESYHFKHKQGVKGSCVRKRDLGGGGGGLARGARESGASGLAKRVRLASFGAQPMPQHRSARHQAPVHYPVLFLNLSSYTVCCASDYAIRVEISC